MRLLRLPAAAALLPAVAAGGSKETASKPANAPAAAEEKPLNVSPSPGGKAKSHQMGGMQPGK